MGKTDAELGDLTIEVKIDTKKKQLIISDNGIGMTEEEVEKYINSIAFSGANEFLEKYKGVDAASLIGHFGLGFYSAFMVADTVEIQTKSHNKEANPVHWKCNGSTEFTLTKGKKASRGTDIILHISEEAKEFLEEGRIFNILKKYRKFLPIPISFRNEK